MDANYAHDPEWNEKYNLLLQFCEEHGHCNATYRKIVTMKEKPFRIGKFIVDQRKFHEEGKLAPERDALLQALVDQGKFQWHCITNSARSDEHWPDMFQTLVEYCKRSPVRPVVTIREDTMFEAEGGKLIPIGRWMHTQNRFHRRNKLRADRLARFETELIEPGLFTWPQGKNSEQLKANNLERLTHIIERKKAKKDAADPTNSSAFIAAQTLAIPGEIVAPPPPKKTRKRKATPPEIPEIVGISDTVDDSDVITSLAFVPVAANPNTWGGIARVSSSQLAQITSQAKKTQKTAQKPITQTQPAIFHSINNTVLNTTLQVPSDIVQSISTDSNVSVTSVVDAVPVVSTEQANHVESVPKKQSLGIKLPKDTADNKFARHSNVVKREYKKKN